MKKLTFEKLCDAQLSEISGGMCGGYYSEPYWDYHYYRPSYYRCYHEPFVRLTPGESFAFATLVFVISGISYITDGCRR